MDAGKPLGAADRHAFREARDDLNLLVAGEDNSWRAQSVMLWDCGPRWRE
jgi:hypothetical protein